MRKKIILKLLNLVSIDINFQILMKKIKSFNDVKKLNMKRNRKYLISYKKIFSQPNKKYKIKEE